MFFEDDEINSTVQKLMDELDEDERAYNRLVLRIKKLEKRVAALEREMAMMRYYYDDNDPLEDFQRDMYE